MPMPESAMNIVKTRPTGLCDRSTTSPKPMVVTVITVMYTQSTQDERLWLITRYPRVPITSTPRKRVTILAAFFSICAVAL